MTESRLSPEPAGVNIRHVLWVSLGLLLLVALAQVAVWALLHGLDARDDTSRLRVAAREANLNELLLDPAQSLHRREYEAGQRELLDSYGWIDREAGVARIPIDRAIQLLLNE